MYLARFYNKKVDSLILENRYLESQCSSLISVQSIERDIQVSTFSTITKNRLDSLSVTSSAVLCVFIGEEFCNSCLFELSVYLKSLDQKLRNSIVILSEIKEKNNVLKVIGIFGKRYKYLNIQKAGLFMKCDRVINNQLPPFLFVYKKNSKNPSYVNPFFVSLGNYNTEYEMRVMKYLNKANQE